MYLAAMIKPVSRAERTRFVVAAAAVVTRPNAGLAESIRLMFVRIKRGYANRWRMERFVTTFAALRIFPRMERAKAVNAWQPYPRVLWKRIAIKGFVGAGCSRARLMERALNLNGVWMVLNVRVSPCVLATRAFR